MSANDRTEIHDFPELVNIMHRLRKPGGCPWDREQTFESLRKYIIEEAYELVEAISERNIPNILEECGDLLLQPVFIAEIARDEGLFSIEDVLGSIITKLIRRHPHVFGEVRVKDSEGVLRNWERIKQAEKHQQENRDSGSSVLSGIPDQIPALLKSYRIQEKAANVGFDWPRDNALPVLDKIEEEISELRAEILQKEQVKTEEEMGDLFFALVNLCRHLDLDPEISLQKANRKFINRFSEIERMIEKHGKTWDDYALAELDEMWDIAKERTSWESGEL